MSPAAIVIKGAREHNLKNIDLEIPRNSLVVVTGLSGSGKSSLAFDTIYAEGQRRYVESLSAYARQFLGVMEKPDVDYIEGLSPAISIEQRTASKNPRSTVGTMTEIYDYLRLLFARVGVPYCPNCGRQISQQNPQQIVDAIMTMPHQSKVLILAPLVRGRKGEYREVFDEIRKEGYVRVRVDGRIRDVESKFRLEKNKKHHIEVVVDRIRIEEAVRGRLADSVETALHLGSGVVLVGVVGDKEYLFSEKYACVHCGISFEELSPRMFSFNSPYGACKACGGLGSKMEVDPQLVTPDPSLSLNQGALAPWGKPMGRWFDHQLRAVAEKYRFALDTPFEKLKPEVQQILLYGSGKEEFRFRYKPRTRKGFWEHYGGFEGVIPNLTRRYRQTESTGIRTWIERFMSVRCCAQCGGARLRKESLSVKIADLSIAQVTQKSVREALDFFSHLRLSEKELHVARQILKEIRERLGFLVNVGLDYLTLDRATSTLAGGEAQRIRLATQIGSQLVGVLYILDEPSIGLHQRDNRRLLDTLTRLRDLGNTVLVVEHDRATILAADHVIDLGPGAGLAGGEVVAQGTPQDIKNCSHSLTGLYLKGEKSTPVPDQRRPQQKGSLRIVGARGNNLKSLTLDIPLGLFSCVAGVSGSGKSTLVDETLYRALAKRFYKSRLTPREYDSMEGLEQIDKVINIDQSPIGRTPRSNPATYTGLFTHIRGLYAQLPESRVRGYRPGRFSFNVKGGRCEACAGDGIIKIAMHFLPDVYVKCEVCKGKRFNRETLEVRYKGKNIAEVLDMTVDQALVFFENIPQIRKKLQTLVDVGLGYIHLGQQATTLSGGEAQRVKLATELSKKSTGRTFYILDEPTTGLHFEDINMLLRVLNRLVDLGNTVLVIEHNMDVLKTADYIIDLGPEGGQRGGEVVAQGTPEEVARNKKSYTGQFLRQELGLS
ncbi:MAG: excinuclease ABC subunit A [candidate division Zixibacteria bacterium SM23_81]|nr:MAG: excinuclease ABC subunit A [candidate division Zixibacteria bacterium SM23_81]